MMHPTNDLLVAYIDDELPQETANEVAAHVAVCTRCSGVQADLRATSQYVLGVLHQIDAQEPAEWSAGSVRQRTFVDGGQRALRRAAVITLVTASGAAAVIMAANRLTRDDDRASEVSTLQTSTTPAATSSGIVIEPRAGGFTIALAGVATGSRLQVVIEERSETQLVVTQANSPRFVSRAGLLEVHMGGGRADLRLEVPPTLSEARIVMGTDTVAVIRGRVVIPAQAAREGIVLSGAPGRQ